MSLFRSLPYFQQINEVNKKLNDLRRANIEILKDEINNPRSPDINTEPNNRTNALLQEVMQIFTNARTQLGIINSVTGMEKTKDTQTVRNPEYDEYLKQRAIYQREKAIWDKQQQDWLLNIYNPWKNLNDMMNLWKDDRNKILNSPRPKGMNTKKWQAAKNKDLAAHDALKPQDPGIIPVFPVSEPKEDAILKKPQPSQTIEVPIQAPSLSTIPQLTDFRKAWQFIFTNELKLTIIYDELLQFSRFLNKENTKVLSKILDSLRPPLIEFYSKYLDIDNNGNVVGVKEINLPLNFKFMTKEMPNNVMRIHNEFGDIYYNYIKLIRDTENNQIIV